MGARTCGRWFVGSLAVALVAICLGFVGVAVAGSSATPGAPTVLKELTAKRTEYSTTYQLSNGQLRTVFSASPVHYQDSSGAWQAINTSFAPCLGTAATAYAATACPVKVTLADQTQDQAPVTVQAGSAQVSLALLGATENNLVVLGNSGLYASVAASTDLSYQATGNGLKETLSLSSAAAPSSFTFQLSHPGLALEQDGTGQWGLYAKGADKPSLVMGALSVYDASQNAAGDPAYCDKAQMTVVPGTDQSTVTYTLPSDWLSDAKRVFPVQVDPSFYGWSGAMDTWIGEASPYETHYAAQQLRCGQFGGQTSNQGEALVEFPLYLSPIPSGDHISAAAFDIFESTPPSTLSNPSHVYRMTQSWTDTNSTWNSLSAPLSGYFIHDAVGDSQHWDEVDCTGTVQGWVQGDFANYGFLLKQADNENATYKRLFASTEYTTPAMNRPQLSVDTEEPQMAASGYQSVYRVGDTVQVTIALSDVANPSQVNNIRMGINRYAGVQSRYRGVVAWFKADPNPSHSYPGWRATPIGSTGNYFAWWDSTGGSVDYGSSHLTPDWGNSSATVSGSQPQVTFSFTMNNDYGNLQNNDFDSYLGMDSGDNTWNSGWANNDTNVDLQAPPLAAAATYTAAPSANWFTETDPNGDGLPDNKDDVNGQGRGSVTLNWQTVAGAGGYTIYLYDGNAFRQVDRLNNGSATSWSSSGKGIYPTDTQIASWSNKTDNPFQGGSGLDLRDNPNALYRATAGTSYDARTDYLFCVVPFYRAPDYPSIAAGDPTTAAALDNRTVHVREDQRSTSYDLGSFVAEHVLADLDKGRLDVTATDLAIASFGPPAALERTYYSTRASSSCFAPGWWFSFQRALSLGALPNKIGYVNEAGRSCSFAKSGSVWLAPNGMMATLAQSGSNWTLTFQDRTVLTFNSTGKLTSEADANGNTVTYTWSGGTPNLMTQITAANGQQISLTYSGSLLSSATYATAAGTREVDYTTASPWQVTTYPNTSLSHVVKYVYASSRLSEIDALDYPASGTNAAETFAYDSASPHNIVTVNFPDHSTNSDAQATIAYTTGSQISSATVTRKGCVGGVSGTIVSQTFSWNVPTGTQASYTNPKTASDGTATWYDEWSPDNQLLREKSPLGYTTASIYDARGDKLVAISACADGQHGHTTSYTYPASDTDPNRDNPSTMTDPLGSTTTYTYDSHSNLTEQSQVLNSAGAQADMQYTYSDVTVGGQTLHGALAQEKQLISGTPSSGTWAVTDYKDLNGNVVYWANGSPEYVISRDVALSDATTDDLTTTSTYDAFGNLLSQTDAGGNETDDTYDLAGDQLTSSGPSFTGHYIGMHGHGETVSTRICQNQSYDAWGEVTASWQTSPGYSTGSKAQWTETTYDVCGRVSEVQTLLNTSAVASTVVNTFDGLGREIASDDTTVGGQPAQTFYDACGNIVESWDEGVASYADDKATRHLAYQGDPGYDAVGEVLHTTAPGDSLPTIDTYTADGNLASETTPDGSETSYSYDAAGNVTSQTDPSGTTSSTYDRGGRLLSQTVPSADSGSFATAYGYDLLGRQTSATGDPDGSNPVAAKTTYNGLGWTLLATNADYTATATAYDACGRVTSATQGTVASTSPYAFTAQQDPTTDTYDACSHPLTETDPDGRTVTYTYDPFANVFRETQVTDAGTVKNTRTNYDSLGRPTSDSDAVTDVNHSWSYPLNTTPDQPPSPAPTRETYDSADPLTTGTWTDTAGNESKRDTTAGSTEIATRTVDSRDAALNWTQATIQCPSSTAITSGRGFDTDTGQLVSQTGAGYASGGQATYTYDNGSGKSGRKTEDLIELPESNPNLGGTIDNGYHYYQGRLARVDVGSQQTRYHYDDAGNLTQIAPDGGSTTNLSYGSPNKPNQLASSQVGNSTTLYYTYDGTFGWRTYQGPSSSPHQIAYTYTATGRLATYDDSATHTQATYAYDARGQRTQSQVTVSSDTTTTNYVYDEAGTLLSLSADENDGETDTTWSIDYLYDEEGVPYGGVYRSPTDTGSPVFFAVLTDQHGDVLELLDANGDPFAGYRYDAWGNPTGTWTANTSLISDVITPGLPAAIASHQVLRYAGYVYDSESGLYYLSARSYDPATAQFISPDLAKADGEESAYQYCGGDPIGRTDPTGLRDIRFHFPFYGTDITSLFKTVLRLCAGHASTTADVLNVVNIPGFGTVIGKLAKYAWWIYKVRTGGQWDFKLDMPANLRSWHAWAFTPNGSAKISAEDFGNIFFGYVGRSMGFSWPELSGGSAVAAVLSAASQPFKNLWKETVGEYHDQFKVKEGYDLNPKWGRQLGPWYHLFYQSDEYVK